ncbi:tryptophan synthase subunit alpha [Campylobacter sp. CCS1377]|uniref:Tryptophan synthase alpha chain n=1 Tax=Campylobacter sp. CCS1377 TaxID=3158229 RepID=A0AAU7E464_9BACT
MVNFKEFYQENANVAYMVMGYPNLEESEKFLNSLDQSSIDILEIGIPYSDPISDGRIISEAALQALNQGTSIHEVFKILENVSTSKTLVFLVYYNLIFSYGIKAFVEKAKSAGIKGLIVPELPFEENEELFIECQKQGIALIALISITTPEERIKQILTRTSGFIYAVASIGITGGEKLAEQRLQSLIEKIRKYTKLPIFAGFGIKNNEDVKKIRKISDGVIVGTSIVALFKDKKDQELLDEIEQIFKK